MEILRLAVILILIILMIITGNAYVTDKVERYHTTATVEGVTIDYDFLKKGKNVTLRVYCHVPANKTSYAGWREIEIPDEFQPEIIDTGETQMLSPDATSFFSAAPAQVDNNMSVIVFKTSSNKLRTSISFYNNTTSSSAWNTYAILNYIAE